MLLPIVLGKVSCVLKIHFVNCMVCGFGKDWRETHGAVMHFPEGEHALHFWCSFLVVHYIAQCTLEGSSELETCVTLIYT